MSLVSPKPSSVQRPAPEDTGAGVQGRSPFGDLSGATVLTVDDEPIMTDLIAAYLEQAGYEKVISVNESERAIEVVRREQPSLLLLDLMMPGVSGFDVLREIRSDQQLRFLPVIVLTAANDPDTKLKALSYGATDFLAKPVDSSELMLRVRNTLAFKAYQDHLINTDTLTGLANRRVLLQRLDGALQRGKRAGAAFALLHLNLDRFREVNDSFGTAVGDELLRLAGQRIETCVRDGDIVARVADRDVAMLARVGGDEFCVLLPALPQAGLAENAARRLVQTMAAPFVIGTQEVVVTASVGIATYPGDGDSAEVLLANATSAMSVAKQEGGHDFSFFSPELNARSVERLTLGTQLRRAVDRDELRLVFQPKVHIGSGRIVGAEALVRWQHPDRGLLAPGHFVSLAEELGLIVAIGEWVLDAACAQCAVWKSAGLPELKVSVNVSQAQFHHRRVADAVAAALRAHDVRPAGLVLELTESMLIGHGGSALNTLNELQAFGVGLSIDDFGTGYSSLSYLKKLPVNELKVDRSFVVDLATSSGDAAIVQAIVTLAHSMRMSVVGEGIETPEQLAMLAKLGCDEYQGYLCSKPVPADGFAQLLLANHARSPANKRGG